MNEHDDVMCLVRESFSGLRMDLPVEDVLAAGRARRRRQRRRLSGLTAAAAATAGAAVTMTLTLGGAAPARSGTPPSPPSPSASPVTLAAFSVTDGPGHSTTLTLYKGAPAGPQRAARGPGAARHTGPGHGRHLLPFHVWCFGQFRSGRAAVDAA